MVRTNLSGAALLLRPRFFAAADSSRWFALRVASILLVCWAFLGVTQARAQDVAEAARQERARKEKESEAKHAKRVYTEEDLAHARILTPEDRAQIEAKRKNEIAPAEKNAPEQADAQALPPDASLGEVARHYRKQKETRQAQQSAQFHLPFGDAVLASPVAPLRAAGVPAAPELGTPRFAPPAASRRIAPSMNSTNQREQWSIVTVRRGDSLWKLAQQNLGQGNRWRELLAANPWIANPDRIEVGRHVSLPATTTVSRSSSKITVQKGDTLSKIAQREFARATFWRCIARANPALRDADRIYEGQELVLPEDCGRLTAQGSPKLNINRYCIR